MADREQLTLAVVLLGAQSEHQRDPVGTARGVSSHRIAQSFLCSASPHVSASRTGSRVAHSPVFPEPGLCQAELQAWCTAVSRQRRLSTGS